MFIIFDLDHTVIDSSHRQLTDANGSLDLVHWRENCTREKIFNDRLLPLAEVMRDYWLNTGHTIVVCTARVCTHADMQFLEYHGLRFDHFISRSSDDMRGDALYKSEKLRHWSIEQGLPENWRENAIMFDDNQAVIARMIAESLLCFDAIPINEFLARKAT